MVPERKPARPGRVEKLQVSVLPAESSTQHLAVVRAPKIREDLKDVSANQGIDIKPLRLVNLARCSVEAHIAGLSIQQLKPIRHAAQNAWERVGNTLPVRRGISVGISR